MKTIHVNERLNLINGYLVTNNKPENRLFMERDIIYSGSSIYCWFMGFILLDLASHEDMVSPALLNKNTAIGKFIVGLEQELEIDMDYDINAHGESLLEQSGLDNKILFCKPAPKFLDLFMVNHNTLGNALLVEFQVQDFESTFTMLVTAIEKEDDKTIKALYCLSPDHSEEPKTYWNAFFEKDNKDAEYPFCWVDYAKDESHRAKLIKTIALLKYKN